MALLLTTLKILASSTGQMTLKMNRLQADAKEGPGCQ
jgi:hypothetical protein